MTQQLLLIFPTLLLIKWRWIFLWEFQLELNFKVKVPSLHWEESVKLTMVLQFYHSNIISIISNDFIHMLGWVSGGYFSLTKLMVP
ncbi:hypothetical protein BOO94_14225 [Pseudomonas sp. FSL W5-0299]|nr:hypothetical protein BOO94_14225 [Pseudomonas sp. FSL W5-0299]